jgi:HSP20 family protein
MALIRRLNRGELSPWSALRDIETQFTRLMNDFGAEFPFGDKSWSPAVDLRETDDAYVVHADVPGVKKDEIDIEIIEDVVTIKGERKEETEKKDGNYHRVERHFGSFMRSIEIPGGFDGEKVSAKFSDGVLEVTLPKLEEKKPRSVKVEAN